MREYVQGLLASLKAQLGQIRARSHVSSAHYEGFVRSYCGDVPMDPARRLYFIDAFVQEVYAHDATCLLQDKLLREIDEAFDGVLENLFCCSMLVDCPCDEPCDWQHAFGQRHSLLGTPHGGQSVLAWDDSRELGVPYSVRAGFVAKTIALLDCKGVCTISGCETKHPPGKINGWRTTFRGTRAARQNDISFCGLCSKHRDLINRLSRKGKRRPANERELRAAIFGNTTDRPLFKDGTTEKREAVRINFGANTNGIPTNRFALYVRSMDQVKWHLSMLKSDKGAWPKTLRLCREADALLR